MHNDRPNDILFDGFYVNIFFNEGDVVNILESIKYMFQCLLINLAYTLVLLERDDVFLKIQTLYHLFLLNSIQDNNVSVQFVPRYLFLANSLILVTLICFLSHKREFHRLVYYLKKQLRKFRIVAICIARGTLHATTYEFFVRDYKQILY